MLEKARFLADNLVCLSIHQDLMGAQILYSCEKINAFVRGL